MRKPWLIGGFCFTLMCWATNATSQSVDTNKRHEALSAMAGFLTAWLDKDKHETTAYFSGTPRAQEVAPRAVWSVRSIGSEELSSDQVDEYWKVLNRLGMPSGNLAPIDPDLKRQLQRFVSPEEHEYGEFTAFVASNAETINSFDGGYGNVAAALQPSDENPIFTMIVDFANRHTERYRGPFVSFWGEESAWRIQALGAVPEVEAWLDGR